jgi:hypothetical protein
MDAMVRELTRRQGSKKGSIRNLKIIKRNQFMSNVPKTYIAKNDLRK